MCVLRVCLCVCVRVFCTASTKGFFELSWLMGAMVEPGKVEGSCGSQRTISVKTSALFRCTSRPRIPSVRRHGGAGSFLKQS